MNKMEMTGYPIYHIRVEGQLDRCWSQWLGGMEIIPLEGGATLLAGPVADQSAVHGLLVKIRDMNLKLISVNKIG
jgi:hypothetical protein